MKNRILDGGGGPESEVFEAGVIHSLKRVGQDSALSFGTLMGQFGVASWYARMLVGPVKSLK